MRAAGREAGRGGNIQSERPVPPAIAPILFEDPSMLLEDLLASESLWPLSGNGGEDGERYSGNGGEDGER